MPTNPRRVQVTNIPASTLGRITHPWQWETDCRDDYVRYFDTKRDALAFLAEQDAEVAS